MDREARSESRRRANWFSRRWRRFGFNGGQYVNTHDGFTVTVWRRRNGSWAGKITDRRYDSIVYSRRWYGCCDAVKIAAFESMLIMKRRRPPPPEPPPPPPPPPREPPASDWWSVLGFRWPPRERSAAAQSYRRLMLAYHTDHGGTDAQTRGLIRAWAEAKAHYGPHGASAHA